MPENVKKQDAATVKKHRLDIHRIAGDPRDRRTHFSAMEPVRKPIQQWQRTNLHPLYKKAVPFQRLDTM